MDIRAYSGGRLVVRQGDITREAVYAVVNAANSSLLGGGGVDGAIHRAGGPTILEECRKIRATRYPEGVPAGRAVMTGGGRLSARFVIHAVGPVWQGGSSGEAELLAGAYRESLCLAAGQQIDSIAFPAISTGAYGYPGEAADAIAFDTITAFLASGSLPRRVILVFFTREDADRFIRVADARG